MHRAWTLAISLLFLAAPIASAGDLYFAEVFNPTFSDGFLRRAATDGSGLEELVATGGGLRGVALDVYRGKMYWTDVDNDVIKRSNFDGTGVQTVVASGLSFPSSIDIDPFSNQIYWGDSILGVIKRADSDGSNVTTLVSTPFHSSVIASPFGYRLYWTTALTSTSGDIMTANLDGSEVETLVTGVGKPSRLALDRYNGKIYWTDYLDDVVRRANLDGTGVETLYTVGANLNPGGIAIDVCEEKVYWGQSTAANRMKILRMNPDGSDVEEVMDGFGGVTEIFCIAKHVCAFGAVHEGCGWTTDLILTVNGWSGFERKVVEVLKYNPIDIRLLEPRSRWGDGQPSRACVYVWHGSAREGDIVAVPKGLGSMCFGPLFLATKTPKRIWNSIGYPLRLGEHTAPGPPPLIPDGFLLDLFSLPYGMDRTLTVTLQGIVEDDCSQGSVPYSVMNGVILKIVDF